jgi:hypothetical protein
MKWIRPQPRRTFALMAAVCAHLLALLALGWRIPKAPAAFGPDILPPVEVQLLRPAPKSAPAASATTASNRARPAPPLARPARPEAPAPTSIPAPQGPAVATGPADCAPEDLPLLTDAEKARCRNAIDADNARRLARGANEKAARQVAEAQRMAPSYRMDPGKQAYYDAVADAYWQQTHGPPMAGHLPSVTCVLPGMPIKKPTKGLKFGPCVVNPPQGFLTEESGLDPLEPQWLPKP